MPKATKRFLLIEGLCLLLGYYFLLTGSEVAFFGVQAMVVCYFGLGAIMLLVALFRALTSREGVSTAVSDIPLSLVAVFMPLAFVFVVLSQLK